MLSRSRLDVVFSQDLDSCLPMSTFTSDASNATTTRYHYTRERSGETTLYTNPYSFQGVGSENDVLYLNIAAPLLLCFIKKSDRL